MNSSIETPRLDCYSKAALADMVKAAREALNCQRVLHKAGLNLVGEILKGQGDFVELDHYPRDDVYDADSGSQYYYHAHREGEHGHFHLFGRPAEANRPGQVKAATHLVAVSMDAWGKPIALFTTNRWVTAEHWRPAPETLALAERFEIDHAWPSWPVNRWLGAMLRCYRPYLEVLLAHRDQEIQRLKREDSNIFEDRRIEVIGQLPVALPAWARSLEQALSRMDRAKQQSVIDGS
ncbi:hypothetical protein FGL86_17135 [Pistricoccus aurantiacus]|uniref:DUF6969 domain-containing protein n=1 Tax=Pistricoccus aurantiacus TaxID=1883414 RepID=A0A5B8SW40_9GAMM|nr:hypothetical protein [Pistricoccus aurantiacus]QEA40631.1 hypothetical protein FGL86_17135 [Pistricoccus aurantiacus]